MKNSANSSFNYSDDGTKLKPQHEGLYVDFQGRRRDNFKKQPFSHPQHNQPRAYQISNSFTPLKLSIQDVFEAVKGQIWVKRPEAKTHDLARRGAKDYCSFHNSQGHQTSQCRSLHKNLEDLVQ